MTSSLQEALLDRRGRTYGRVWAISASLGGVLGTSWPDVGPFWDARGLEHSGVYKGGVQTMGSR